jgi:hypothetical protein
MCTMSMYVVGPHSFGITCLISGVDTHTDELAFDHTYDKVQNHLGG